MKVIAEYTTFCPAVIKKIDILELPEGKVKLIVITSTILFKFNALLVA